jgi:hypothetical protein
MRWGDGPHGNICCDDAFGTVSGASANIESARDCSGLSSWSIVPGVTTISTSGSRSFHFRKASRIQRMRGRETLPCVPGNSLSNCPSVNDNSTLNRRMMILFWREVGKDHNFGDTSAQASIARVTCSPILSVYQKFHNLCFCSVGVCLPGGLWAEISNFAEFASHAVQPERWVAIRRRERCAAAMTATRAINDTAWLER